MHHSLLEYIHLGGYVMYILIFLNILGLSIILWKFIQIRLENLKAEKNALSIINDVKNKYSNKDTEEVKDEIYNKASSYLFNCENGMVTIQIIATISPILGLLGTVIGVLQSFETIAQSGFSQGANFFASGISLALITTIGGLIVAIPAYIGYNYLSKSFERLGVKYEMIISYRLNHEKIS